MGGLILSGKKNIIISRKTKARRSLERSFKLKLTINQNMELIEDEIIINCAYMDGRMQKLVEYIRRFTFSLEGEQEGKIYQIPVEEIYYVDSVDGKTFLYDKEHSYYCRQTLAALEKRLEHTTFTRISKSCLLNTEQLKCVEPYVNHRMKAELKNGEQLLISRNYIETLKGKLRG